MNDRTDQLIKMILNGESFRAADKKLGFCKNGARTSFHLWVRKIDPELYDKGLMHGECNNYRTPTLEYLRNHKDEFLNIQPCLQKKIKTSIAFLEERGYKIEKIAT